MTASATEIEHDRTWRRLDGRMLLVHPVNEVVRFLPFLIGVFLLGSGSEDGGPWHYLGVVIPIGIGVFRYLSTRFRITSGQIELRRGILSRSVLTVPLDRVRTVELTASPIHRVLQLERVTIGTGSSTSDDGLVLDSLGSAEAHRLRHELLSRSQGPDAADLAGTDSATERVLVRFDPAWARFAPLTTAGLVVAVAAAGAALGPLFGNTVETQLVDSGWVNRLLEITLPALVVGGLVFLMLLASALGIVGYLLSNWDFIVTRDDARRTFRVRRGALTTRETTIDLDRLRGVEIHQPLGLRLAGGGRLHAIVTGIDRRASANSAALVPAAPRTIVEAVSAQVLGEHDHLVVPLRQHGPAARRRRYLRAVVPGVALLAFLTALAARGGWSWWLPVLATAVPVAGVFFARDRYARLGHALTPEYVVIRWGSLRGRRDAVQRTGIIGWNITQSYFQRRAGLVSLTATTAAGAQGYQILDIPETVAAAFAAQALPGLAEQFLVEVRSAS